MFFRVFLLFALVAMAFASPKPEPQAFTYTAPGVYSAYTGYAGYPYGFASPYAAAAVPYAYSGYYLR